MTAAPDETRTAINTALDALERGDRATAQRLAWLAVALAPGSETPWLILAAAAGNIKVDYAVAGGGEKAPL